MKNENIKKYINKFKKLYSIIGIENFGDEVLYNTKYVMLKFDKDNNLNIKFYFHNNNDCEFNLNFKGKLVKDNNLKNIKNKHNYYLLFNKLCKGLKKYEVENNKNNLLNYLKIIDELDINCQNMEYIKLLLELIVNKHIIRKYIKIIYYDNYELIKYNENVYNIYINRLKNKFLINKNNLTKQEIYNKIRKSKILNKIYKLDLIEYIYENF